MGSLGRSSALCCLIQGLAVWRVVLADEQWTVKLPERMSAPIGSCMVIPCSFTPPTSDKSVNVIWYQYAKFGYPLVYSESKPSDVIDGFRDRTELIGKASEGNCSLKIIEAQASQNGQVIYVWIEPNQLTSRFYAKTVTLEVTADAPQPEIQVLKAEDLRVDRSPAAQAGIELTKGDAVTAFCDVIHTCPPSPPSVSFRDHRAVPQWSHREEGAGRWRVSVQMSWTVSARDHGMGVACDVTHPGGLTASREFVLEVTYPPKSVYVHGDRTVVPPGGRVFLSCRSRANPPADSFQWYRVFHGQPTLLDRTSETVTITELYREENLFRCMASNSMGSGRSPDFEVIKEYKPSISGDSQCSLSGGFLSCGCEATARPAASLRWRVEGMVPDPTTLSAQSSAVSGLVVRGTWTGEVTTEQLRVVCVCSNLHGQEERILRVYEKAPPTNISVTQHPSRPREGVGVTLACTSQGSPPVSGYRWYRGQAGLEIGLEEKSRDLRVATITRGSGPYRCAAHNQMGEASSPITWLNVEYAPDILPDSSCILGNGQIRCECVVDANPTAQVTWFSVSSSTNEKRNTSSTLSGRVLRSIVTVDLGDEGHHFYCNATNEHGDAFYRLTFAVGHLGKWAIVFGVAGGAVPLCLLLGAIFYCKRTKSRRRKHTPSTDLPLKKKQSVVEEEVKTDCFYENTGTVSPTHPPPESVYELADTPTYQELKRQPDYDEPVYTNL